MLQAIDYTEVLYHLGIDFDERDEQIKKRVQKRVSFRKWKNALHKIISYELENGNINKYNTTSPTGMSTECDKIIFNSLKSSCSEFFYGLNTEIIHIAYVLRLILESCNSKDEIVLDFSNLNYWAEDCVPKAIAATEDIEKTIVLVEGTSDKDILEFAMQKLYPHLSDLFYFMDFYDARSAKRGGGASYVVANIKTFYFSRLKSRFIAIFDNDAEGYQNQIKLLSEIKHWPDNFKILTYPAMSLFCKYPTLAPNGSIMFDNINKKACSIELYLPDDFIKVNDEYFPIEWESRKKIELANGSKEFKYQGVISKKDEVKEKFHELRRKIENEEKTLVPEEWERVRLLLETIVFCICKRIKVIGYGEFTILAQHSDF